MFFFIFWGWGRGGREFEPLASSGRLSSRTHAPAAWVEGRGGGAGGEREREDEKWRMTTLTYLFFFFFNPPPSSIPATADRIAWWFGEG